MLAKVDLEKLSQARIDDALLLLNAQRYSSAYYLAGYAIELAIKACIAGQMQLNIIPDKALILAIYTHKLDHLLSTAGLLQIMNSEIKTNVQLGAYWVIVNDWSPESRYSMWDSFAANSLIAAVSDPKDGVIHMGEITLVESRVIDAIKLVEALDKNGISPSLVAWYFYDDVDEWRLLVAGVSLEKHLPNSEALAYREILNAFNLAGVSSIGISDVKLISLTSPLAKSISTLIRTDSNGFARAYFTNERLNGIFVKSTCIIRSSS